MSASCPTWRISYTTSCGHGLGAKYTGWCNIPSTVPPCGLIKKRGLACVTGSVAGRTGPPIGRDLTLCPCALVPSSWTERRDPPYWVSLIDIGSQAEDRE